MLSIPAKFAATFWDKNPTQQPVTYTSVTSVNYQTGVPNMFTYSCEICHMTFGKKTALYNHRKNTHRKLEMMNVDSAVSWE